MIFLKKLYAEGFKSFAKPTTINFDHNMTAIVGPNGSGKSNVVDAIKWTIGEQSNKQLRASDKTNLIFMGSENISESDFALVELTFDNTSRVLNVDLDEVKICRKLIRKSGESIYTLNDEPAKLREIQEIFLDTGLTKGSLCMITQGAVTWFSEAKAEERRKIFEEAAGIGKYTKRKNETLKLLEAAKNNLDDVSIRVKGIEKELRSLETQAKKLEEYRVKSAKLKELDLTIKAKDYTTHKNIYDQYTQMKLDSEQKKDILLSNIDHYKFLIDEKNKAFDLVSIEINELEAQKDKLSDEFTYYNNKINAYKQKLNNDLNSNDPQLRIKSYAALINEEKIKIEECEKRKITLDEENTSNKEKLEKVNELKKSVQDELKVLNDQLTIKSNRLNELKKEQDTANKDNCLKKILANKESFPGIVGPLSELIKVKPRYETAITTALSGSIKNLVTLNEQTAVDVINFIRKNSLGYLTCLPLDVIQTRSVHEEILNAIKGMKGFVDIAANLVTIDEAYKKAVKHLLGNVLIVDDLNNATVISKFLQQKFRIITLEGDVKNIGGSLSGGVKKESNILNIAEKIETLEKEYADLKGKQTEKIIEETRLKADVDQLESDKNLIYVRSLSNDNKLKECNQNLITYKAEYDALVERTQNIQFDNSETNEEKLILQMNEVQNNLSDVDMKLQQKKKKKDEFLNESRSYIATKDENERELQKVNQSYSLAVEQINKSQNIIAAIEHEVIQNYQLAIEVLEVEYLNKELEISEAEARRTIAILKSEIKALGHIDEEVLIRLENKQKEFDNIDNEYNDSLNAYNKLQEIVTELDKKAITDFKNLIKKVNENIPAIFNKLFGGGYCEIQLTDPNNILESGINIVVQPKGKKVKNLTLLSGGEKTLVALTVLFAIVQSSKLPLIVLDEAEAALDELNVEIFAKIIKDYANKAQFIVITHRPGTMKEASVLYGVTMQDKGVSMVIKKTFDEISTKE